MSSVFGGASSVNITVSATSSPANTYFDREITLTVDPIPVNSDPSLRSWYGATYKYMTKVSGSLAEFVIKEDQSTSGGTTYNVFAGAYNTSTGVLRYEARMNTAQDPITSTSFYRHIRLLGDLAITGSTVTGIEDLAFAYGNSSKTEVNPTDLAQTRAYTYAGFLVTAKGDLTKGIKARGWKATNGSGGAPTDYTAHFTTAPSNWVEIPNTYCFASSSDELSPCQTAGIDGYSAGDWQKFTYIYSANPTLPSDFYNTYPGMNFTQVDVNVDLPWTPTQD